MRISIFVLLIATPLLSAQEDAGAAPWVEHFDGRIETLTAWTILGDHRIEDGSLILGTRGGKGAVLRLATRPPGEFGVLIEYRTDGPDAPTLEVEHAGMLTAKRGRRSLPAGQDWLELALLQKPAPDGNGYQWIQSTQNATRRMSNSSAAIETRPVRHVEIIIPAGTVMAIRRIRVQGLAAPTEASLAIPLTVLGVLLLAILAVGCWQRRRSTWLGRHGRAAFPSP